jgi:hypothetical protein
MMRVFFSVGLGNGRSTPSPSRRQSAHIMPRFRRVDPAATIAAVPRTRPGSRHDLPGPASRADVVLASRTATRAKQPCLGRIAMRSTTATPPPGPRGWPAPDSVLRTLGSRLYQPLSTRPGVLVNHGWVARVRPRGRESFSDNDQPHGKRLTRKRLPTPLPPIPTRNSWPGA